jgi:hypothetical protein
MNARKERREVARWENMTRAWATETGRALALDLYLDRDLGVHPYNVGVVLAPGEKAWVQIPARCLSDTSVPFPAGPPKKGDPPPAPAVSAWLVTNHRVVGRLATHQLAGWRWQNMVGCRVDLTPGAEHVSIDIDKTTPISWTGPGVGPLAVAAVYHLHGSQALIDHPGLDALRVPRPTDGTSPQRPMLSAPDFSGSNL